MNPDDVIQEIDDILAAMKNRADVIKKVAEINKMFLDELLTAGFLRDEAIAIVAQRGMGLGLGL